MQFFRFVPLLISARAGASVLLRYSFRGPCLRFRITAFTRSYTNPMQRKMFWITFAVLGLVTDMVLPFWWAVAATVPVMWLSWWVAYRSDWF